MRSVFAGALAALMLLSCPALAQTSPSLTTACPAIPNPDGLKILALHCAADLAYDRNCRAETKDGNEEYALIQDCSPKKPQGYLLVPVTPVTGIEDSKVINTPLTNLWQDAWIWSEKYPGKPAADTALAINSTSGRSQNQLHIHISCVLPEVKQALSAASVPLYPAKPVTLMLGPKANRYTAIRVAGLTDDNSPFKVIRETPGIAQAMQDQSIAVIGSSKSNEYYVLNTTAGAGNRGHAEELLDQACGGR